MKKLVPFLAALLVSSVVMAQSAVNYLVPEKSSHKWMELRQDFADPESPFAVNVVPTAPKAAKWPISSSANVYTLLVPESSCLHYSPDIKTVSFIHRSNPAAGPGTSSGNIVASYSRTNGVLWNQLLMTNDSKSNRYPSGVLYNPTGNNEYTNAYVVASGPVTDGTNWIENFWASLKLDNTNPSVVYENYATYNQEFPRLGFTACSDGKLHVLGTKYVFTSGVGTTSFSHVTMNTGTFNSTSNKFDWARNNIVPSFASPGFDNALEVSSYSTAWSPNGTVGFIYFIGIDSAYDQTSYQPILYKTTNSGASWTKVAPFDFTTISTIQDSIWPTRANDLVAQPYFSDEGEAVVDNNGVFHWFGIIKGAYSLHPDSLGYTYVFEDNKLYHVWTTPSGYDAEFVDFIWTKYVATTDGQYGSGTDATGWDHRIQAARSTDGSKIFCVWSDTDTLYAVLDANGRAINSSPDLHAWGKNLSNSTYYPSTNFTAGTPIEAECFFHYVSEVIIEDGTNLIIPVTVAEIDQVSANGPALPVYHFYVTNIGFGPTIGLSEVQKHPVADVSELYPNPTNGNTNLDITLNETSDLSLKIFDISGRVVLAEQYKQLGQGLHRLSFDMSDASKGMYIFRIEAGNKSISRKLSVK